MAPPPLSEWLGSLSDEALRKAVKDALDVIEEAADKYGYIEMRRAADQSPGLIFFFGAAGMIWSSASMAARTAPFCFISMLPFWRVGQERIPLVSIAWP